jgi:hypothetical protein
LNGKIDFNGADDLAHADLSGSKISAEAVGMRTARNRLQWGRPGEKGGIFFNEANLPTTPT